MLPDGWPPPAPCIRQTRQPLTAGFLHRKPERFECAVHRGDECALCMGFASLSIGSLPPMVHIAHKCLSAALNVHTLNRHDLLGFSTLFLQGVQLGKIGAAQASH